MLTHMLTPRKTNFCHDLSFGAHVWKYNLESLPVKTFFLKYFCLIHSSVLNNSNFFLLVCHLSHNLSGLHKVFFLYFFHYSNISFYGIAWRYFPIVSHCCFIILGNRILPTFKAALPWKDHNVVIWYHYVILGLLLSALKTCQNLLIIITI